MMPKEHQYRGTQSMDIKEGGGNAFADALEKYASAMLLLWLCYAFPMLLLCFAYGFAMGLSWCCYDSAILLLWFSYGFPEVFL